MNNTPEEVEKIRAEYRGIRDRILHDTGFVAELEAKYATFIKAFDEGSLVFHDLQVLPDLEQLTLCYLLKQRNKYKLLALSQTDSVGGSRNLRRLGLYLIDSLPSNEIPQPSIEVPMDKLPHLVKGSNEQD